MATCSEESSPCSTNSAAVWRAAEVKISICLLHRNPMTTIAIVRATTFQAIALPVWKQNKNWLPYHNSSLLPIALLFGRLLDRSPNLCFEWDTLISNTKHCIALLRQPTRVSHRVQQVSDLDTDYKTDSFSSEDFQRCLKPQNVFWDFWDFSGINFQVTNNVKHRNRGFYETLLNWSFSIFLSSLHSCCQKDQVNA